MGRKIVPFLSSAKTPDLVALHYPLINFSFDSIILALIIPIHMVEIHSDVQLVINKKFMPTEKIKISVRNKPYQIIDPSVMRFDGNIVRLMAAGMNRDGRGWRGRWGERFLRHRQERV